MSVYDWVRERVISWFGYVFCDGLVPLCVLLVLVSITYVTADSTLEPVVTTCPGSAIPANSDAAIFEKLPDPV